MRPIFRFTWGEWYWSYSSYLNSKPFAGYKSHQLCVGPFTWEWMTKEKANG